MNQEIRRDALIVGINTYEYPRLKGLKAPAQDAEAIARMLTKYGNFRVRRLPAVKDKENLENDLGRVGQTTPVTLTQLEEALNQLFLPEGDYIPETALVFFSGHGLRKQKGKRYEGYLATSDVNPEKHHWGFSLQYLRQILQDSPVRQQIVWLDCCHSGELFNFKENSQEAIFLEEENLDEADPGNQEERDRCFVTASRAFEVAREKASGTHGVLTGALLKGLDPQERPDGWVTTHTLADFINKELKTETQRPLCHNSGSPIILTTCKPKLVNSPDEGICPYKGLEYFKQEDAHFFWGRTALTDELIEQVRTENFVAVLGASGSGKSSVLRAGLLHQLNLGVNLTGSNRWQIYQPFTPGDHPLQNLEAVIGRAANELNQLVTEAETNRVVLVVDQFEECFTMCQDSRERKQFFDCLLNAVEREDNKLCLVLGMRADFLGKCAEYAGLASKIDKHLVTVKPMNSKELEEAILKPAEQVGLQIEPQLVTRMIEDVAESPGSLPLLQYTLMELWKARQEPLMNWLTLFSYEQLGGDKGGIKGILEERANEVYESLEEEEKPVAQRIFLELTQLGEVADTRRRVQKEDLINKQNNEVLLNRVITKLVNARLITTDEWKYKDSKLGNVIIDIAHEVLIRYWHQLRDWVEEYRVPLEIERKIEAAAKEWESKGKLEETGLLLQGARLIEAEDYLKNYLHLGFLDGLAQDYIQLSRKESDRLVKEEKDRQQREVVLLHQSRLRLKLLVAFLITALVGTTGLLTYPELLRWRAIWLREMVDIPGGTGIFGRKDSKAQDREKPQWFTQISDFQIDKFKVSNYQYRLCVLARRCGEPPNPSLFNEPSKLHEPVYLTAFQAAKYCKWLGRQLPTELEWERAARSYKGDELYEIYVKKISQYGIHDLVGKPFEWTRSIAKSPLQKYGENYDKKLLLNSYQYDASLIIRGGEYDKINDAFTTRMSAFATLSEVPITMRCVKYGQAFWLVKQFNHLR